MAKTRKLPNVPQNPTKCGVTPVKIPKLADRTELVKTRPKLVGPLEVAFNFRIGGHMSPSAN